MYLKAPEADRKPCMFVLDSLGMLSTEKEITDALNEKAGQGHDKIPTGQRSIPYANLEDGTGKDSMIVTNHTYDVVGAYVPTKEMVEVVT